MKIFFVTFVALLFFVLCPNIAEAVEVRLLDGSKEIGTVTIKNEPDVQLISVASLFKALGLEAKTAGSNGLFARDKNERSVNFFDGTNVVRSLGEIIIAKKPVKYEKPYLWCDVQTAFNACQKFLKANGRSVSLALKGSDQQRPSLLRDETKPITITVEPEKKVYESRTTGTKKFTTWTKPMDMSNSTQRITSGTNQSDSVTTGQTKGTQYQPTKPVTKPATPQKPATSPTTQKLMSVPEPKVATESTKEQTKQEQAKPKVIQLPKAIQTQPDTNRVTDKTLANSATTTPKTSTAIQKLMFVSEPNETTEMVKEPLRQEQPRPRVVKIPTTTQAQPAKAIFQTTSTVAKAQPAVAKAQPIPTTSHKPIVVLDAGHGGHDPGAMANNVKEKDIVLKAVLELAEILRDLGIDVRLTRSTDVYLKLSERTAIANKYNANVFVSLHCNSLAKKNASVSGLEYYIMALPRDKDSMALAIAENKELAGGAGQADTKTSAVVTDKKTKILLQILGDMQQNGKIDESTTFAEYLYNASIASGLKMRKVVQAPFFVLRGAAMPAVLAELGYLTNKEEAQKLTTVAYRQKLCNTIASGIVNYLREHPTITE